MRFQLNRYTADQKGNKCHPGACGKVFQLHRRRSWWSGWLTLTGPWCLIILFYPVCFSGVGVFQVKYDGQLRIDEDEHSLACDFHCMRVEKNNSGKVEPATICEYVEKANHNIESTLLGLWQVAEWRISDAAFGQGGPYHADIWIQSVDDEDDIFGMLEVSEQISNLK